jgi:hypothetical protein
MRPERLDGEADVGFLIGRTVQRIGVSYQFELELPQDEDRVVIALTTFTYREPSGNDHVSDADSDRVGLGNTLALFGREITEASTDRGSLRLRFDDESELSAPPLEAYESWQINGPGTALLVCMPGGELASSAEGHSGTI